MVRNGLKVGMSGAQLRELVVAKRDFFAKRAVERRERAQKRKDADLEYNEDEYQAKIHENDARGMDLFLKFLNDDDGYELDHDDMGKLLIRE